VEEASLRIAVQFLLAGHQARRDNMYKLITILVAAIPIIVFLKSVFFGRSQAWKQASSELRRQIDYLVWAILALIACGILYSTINLIHPLWK
jgi:type IV secretory pathway VirB2 component (pilin)